MACHFGHRCGYSICVELLHLLKKWGCQHDCIKRRLTSNELEKLRILVGTTLHLGTCEVMFYQATGTPQVHPAIEHISKHDLRGAYGKRRVKCIRGIILKECLSEIYEFH